MPTKSNAHLKRLEAESIRILRQVATDFERPVLLYSVGKDSSVLLHLAMKAFYPGKPPFPLLHVDTTWKFKEMIQFRDDTARRLGLELIVYTNPEGLANNTNPFTHGSSRYTDIMKTEALKQALDIGKYDAAIGGARRDEEKSRAKERVFSHRSKGHVWDPKNQRPELWKIYNTRKAPGESIRVFPLSNWTELDIWQYIGQDGIALPSIYFSHEREVFERDGMLMAANDFVPRMPSESLSRRIVRFRTVGDMTCTAAVSSEASTVDDVIAEIAATRLTERGASRADDKFSEAAMEDRKREGYF
jgi:sulfate adenylyltransferase subunit 2